MKSYIQGLITGAVFVFALIVLVGSTKPEPNPPQYGSGCDQDEIISRILFCLDGATVTVGMESGTLSTYCDR